jgi:drug/metabolite transporter, DME family
MTSRRATVEVLAAAALFGTTGTARALGAASASPLGVGAARLALGGALLLALLRLRPGASPRVTAPLRPVLAAGVLAGVYQLAFFAGLDRAGVAVGTVVTIGSGPPLAGALGALAGQGRPTRRWALATALAVAGIAVLANPSGGADPAGIGLALLAGLGYAGYTVVVKRAIDRGADGGRTIGAAFAVGGALLLPALVYAGPGWLGTGSGLATAAYLGLAPTAIAYVLFARGLARLDAATVTTLVLAEPLVATLLGAVVLGERLGVADAAGGVLVLTGLAVLAGGRRATTRRAAAGAPDRAGRGSRAAPGAPVRAGRGRRCARRRDPAAEAP